MAILDRLNKQQTPHQISDQQLNGNNLTRVAHELARRYRDRLISELPEKELEQLVTLPSRMRESKIAGWVTDMIREEQQLLAPQVLSEIIDIVKNEMVGLGPLQPLLRDPSISEIMVNWVRGNEEHPDGYSQIYIERVGRLELAPPEIKFENQAHLRHIIDRIVSPLGRRIDESSPRVDARLPDGSRVNAVIPPLAVDGPILTVRKFRRAMFTEVDLVDTYGTLTQDMLTFMRACVKAKLNILVSGGTGSGKTTTLNVLSTFIPHSERIITIEDAAELRLYESHPHVVRLEARPPNVEGEGAVSIQELVKNALRMRPDRIIVGEVRGGEALDMLQAMNTGHEGSMTTIHSNSTRDAFARLENMVMMAESAKQLPLQPIREQLASAIDIVIQQNRLPGGGRRIVSVSEVRGLRKGQIMVKDVFLFQQTGIDERGQALGYFTPTGVKPKFFHRLQETLSEEEFNRLDGIFSLDYFTRELGAGLMNDNSVSEIMINAPDEIYIEQHGRLRQISSEEIRSLGGSGLRHAKHLEHIVETIAARLGRRIDEDRPMLDARLPDGSRVNAILPPLTLDKDGHRSDSSRDSSAVITIRRFPEPLVMADLLRTASLSPQMAEFLEACIRTRLNLVVSGGTGSGKTTLLNVLSSFIPDWQRIITIEDVAELQLRQPHWVRLETRPADEFGENEIKIRDLVRNSLRMRPDRIVVGESRGAEALDILQAMNTGHSGSMTTAHANSPRDAMSRLETMVRMSPEARELSSREIMEQISILDIVVQSSRMADGSRKIIAVCELTRDESEQIVLKEIFNFEQVGLSEDDPPQVVGSFRATGYVPNCLEYFTANGIDIDEQIFNRSTVTHVRGNRFTS
ncbi:MAG: ATPase, T2SS/T4P/T4SS family [Ardenticatenaceae bacterium]|nr:ATPase, T2SS/T4P/T4SS family [Ardenticatenaceae bacterium]